MLRFEAVSKRFGSLVVLDDISFSLSKGEIVFLIGKSGTGKSVLLKHVVGLLKADSGKIILEEEEVSGLNESQLFDIRKKCGMIFQAPALLDSLSVFENVVFGIRAHRLVKRADQRAKVSEYLKLVSLDASLLDRYPGELSFAVQKRVSIARTLAIEPTYLLFDEPTTGQDPIHTEELNRLIESLAKKLNLACLVVSHDMHCALSIADRILLLSEGKIRDEGSPDKLQRSQVPLTKAFLREAMEWSDV